MLGKCHCGCDINKKGMSMPLFIFQVRLSFHQEAQMGILATNTSDSDETDVNPPTPHKQCNFSQNMSTHLHYHSLQLALDKHIISCSTPLTTLQSALIQPHSSGPPHHKNNFYVAFIDMVIFSPYIFLTAHVWSLVSNLFCHPFLAYLKVPLEI